jgi:hypothetical protein
LNLSEKGFINVVGCTEKTGKAHFQASSWVVVVECQENLGFLFTSRGKRCIMVSKPCLLSNWIYPTDLVGSSGYLFRLHNILFRSSILFCRNIEGLQILSFPLFCRPDSCLLWFFGAHLMDECPYVIMTRQFSKPGVNTICHE